MSATQIQEKLTNLDQKLHSNTYTNIKNQNFAQWIRNNSKAASFTKNHQITTPPQSQAKTHK